MMSEGRRGRMGVHRDGLLPVPFAGNGGSARSAALAAFPERGRLVDAAFDAGDVVDSQGMPVPAERITVAGEPLYVFRPVPDEPSRPIVPTVLGEGNGWLAIDKPAGMATTPKGSHVARSAVVVVRRFLGNPHVVPAHRIDAATRGVLVLVTDPALRGAFQTQFERREVRKQYLAVAAEHADFPCGEPRTVGRRLEKPRGSLQTMVVPGVPNSSTRIQALRLVSAGAGRGGVRVGGPGGDMNDVAGTQSFVDDPEAWRGVTADGEERGDLCLYSVEPLTGKTHQIRAVFADLGMPIVGDWLYPDVTTGDTGHLQLLAQEIEFTEPGTGKRVSIRSMQSLDWS